MTTRSSGQHSHISFPRKLLFHLASPVVLAALAYPAPAADGDLDPTFGTGGKVVTDFNNSTDWLSRVAVQPDGKIIAIGDTHPSHKGALIRYNPDGTLDATFGSGGKVITPASVRESAAGLLLLPDGKIMTSGSIDLPSMQDTSFALVRFNADGSIDPTFGNGGIVATNIASRDDKAYAIARQPDGKIVAAGRRGIQIEPAQQRKGNVALVRYNPAGPLDATFGNSGIVINKFGQGLESYALQLIIQPNGKLVIAGESSYEFLVARYNSNGTLDSTFGNGGYRLANFSSNWDGATDALLQPDGKIVLVGWSELNSAFDSFALARFNADGSFDQGFGNGGKVLLVDRGDLNAVVRQSDGKLIAIGSGNYTNDPAFHLLRFEIDGALDSTWGSGGSVTTDFGQPTEGVALALQPDGKLIVGGLTSSNPCFDTSEFALARYELGSLQMTGAVSRKTHGSAGIFDLPLPLIGTPGVECRSSGDHTLLFTFNGSIVNGSASAMGGTATIARSATYSGNTMAVDLTGVADAQTITLMLSDVTDSAGHVLPPTTFRVSFLLGDTSGDGVVNTADALQTRSRSGLPAEAATSRADVNLDGIINASDALIVRAHSGNSLP
ncbi:MAG: dockerin type I domain-containing protein [Verrucomicrobiota bacterium]|nr:dockerin type I domain-containing protein [Verrucomicrobiota bacterium]